MGEDNVAFLEQSNILTFFMLAQGGATHTIFSYHWRAIINFDWLVDTSISLQRVAAHTVFLSYVQYTINVWSRNRWAANYVTPRDLSTFQHQCETEDMELGSCQLYMSPITRFMFVAGGIICLFPDSSCVFISAMEISSIGAELVLVINIFWSKKALADYSLLNM